MANLCGRQQCKARSSSRCCFEKIISAYGLPYTYDLAKQIVMTDKSLRSFSAFVSVAREHFTRSDGINELQNNL